MDRIPNPLYLSFNSLAPAGASTPYTAMYIYPPCHPGLMGLARQGATQGKNALERIQTGMKEADWLIRELQVGMFTQKL